MSGYNFNPEVRDALGTDEPAPLCEWGPCGSIATWSFANGGFCSNQHAQADKIGPGALPESLEKLALGDVPDAMEVWRAGRSNAAGLNCVHAFEDCRALEEAPGEPTARGTANLPDETDVCRYCSARLRDGAEG